MKYKWLLLTIVIAAVGLVGCGGQRSKEETVNDIVAEDNLEMDAEETVDTIAESKDSVTEEKTTVESETVTTPEAIVTLEPVETSEPPKERFIDFSKINVSFAESESVVSPLTLTVVSEKENNVSEISDWISESQLSLPMLGEGWTHLMTPEEKAPIVSSEMTLYGTSFYDDNYLYNWTSTGLNIYDRNSCQLLYAISYQMDQWYLMGNCAYLRDGILYIGYLYNGYAMPGTCYLLAYDIENEKVLWRSEDQTYNTMNFIVKEDIIICGYGFTAEKDYIYQIDRNTGKVISKTELQKMPELLVEKDGQLYVHTYSYDYVLDMSVD